MVGYAIEVPGTKRVVRIRRGGYEHFQEFVDIALAQERLRATIARVVGLPYSMDPFIESMYNLTARLSLGSNSHNLLISPSISLTPCV